ncbi:MULTISPECIES: hypothetical protein [unclassified Pseudonocardia]|uniref:hypothetical protein n=1 Tax=unclassified Pseudonocardia TaxID=2619320 RepID=UPI001CF6B447|nr:MULTISPECIES: hypothetical protein [unclassified Pseudonocardia]
MPVPELPATPEPAVPRALTVPVPRLGEADRAEALEVIGHLDPAVLAAVLGRAQPTAPLLVAARVGVEVADLRHAHLTALRDASTQVSVAYTAAGLARQPSWAELMRRRYPPHGDPTDWATRTARPAA